LQSLLPFTLVQVHTVCTSTYLLSVVPPSMSLAFTFSPACLAQDINFNRGLGSSVSIATNYGLDGPGIASRWGARFFAHVQTEPGAHPASCRMGTRSFLGVKRPELGADHPTPSSAEVENE
jgi:hypothetical protein